VTTHVTSPSRSWCTQELSYGATSNIRNPHNSQLNPRDRRGRHTTVRMAGASRLQHEPSAVRTTTTVTPCSLRTGVPCTAGPFMTRASAQPSVVRSNTRESTGAPKSKAHPPLTTPAARDFRRGGRRRGGTHTFRIYCSFFAAATTSAEREMVCARSVKLEIVSKFR